MIRNHRFFVFNCHLSNLIKAFGISIIFLALALIMSRGAFAASISGTVYQNDGSTPVTGVEIDVHVLQGDPCEGFQRVGGVWTNPSNGTYTIMGLPLGIYYLWTYNANQSNYVNEWWASDTSGGSSYDCEDAEAIVISVPDEEITGKDFQLDLGGSISGTVYESDGSTPVMGVEIDIRVLQGDPCGESQKMGGAWTDPSNGTYTIMGLPLGSYYLETYNANQSNYVDEWWASGASSYDCGDAEAIVISVSDQSVTGTDFQLDLGGSISGQVTTSGGVPIAGLVVHTYSATCYGGKRLGGADTDENGNYVIYGLPVGNVYVGTCSSCRELNYIDEWWDGDGGSIDCEGAAAVVVEEDQDTPGINFTLAPDSDSDGMGDDWEFTHFGDLSHDGTADSDNDGLSDLEEFLNGTDPNDQDSDNDAVNDGQEISYGTDPNDPLSFTPQGTGAIRGVVKDESDVPITSIQIEVRAISGDPCGDWHVVESVLSNPSDGTYAVVGLPPGNYYLRVDNMSQSNYLNEWWAASASVIDCGGAQTVAVSEGGMAEGKDFQLDLGGSISGTVYESDGVTPLTGVQFEVWAIQGDPCGESQRMGLTWTDPSTGNYKMVGVPPGNYYLQSWNRDESNYLDEWWAAGSSVYDCNFAESFTVESGKDITGKDFQLQEGGMISGTITDIFGNPIGWPVLFFPGCEGPPIISTWSNDDGIYMSEVPAGDVYVASFWPLVHIPLYLYYLEEWYDGNDGADDCELAVPVPVTAGELTEGIDFALVADPRRLSHFTVAVYNGILNAGFDVLPGFTRLLERAILTGPGGFSYEFDLENDVLEWLTECSYLVSWSHEFSSTFEYGEYTLTLVFLDGAEKTYTKGLQPVDLTPVPSSSMNHVVNPDGSIDFSWTPPSPDQYYQLRIYSSDRQTRYYRSSIMVNETSLRVLPGDLQCLEIGGTYYWQVRTLDETGGSPIILTNAVERGQNKPLTYNPVNLGGRTSWFVARSHNGNLGLGFDVRPGSRDHIDHVTVTGPDGSGFSYTFDLTNDWYDVSTETRNNRGWWREFAPPIAYGDYTFQVEFSDGYTETPTTTLEEVDVTPVDSATMEQLFYGNGDITFSWALPVVTGQIYRVRIRSLDGTKEYYRSSKLYDGSEVTASFWELRALELGQNFQWRVLAYDPGFNTMEQSASVVFRYNPYAMELPDTDGDGVWDVYDEDDDNDGIADLVDTASTIYSNDFSDGTTTGSITSRGDQLLTITDEAGPDGVRITASTDGGPIKAKVSACGGAASYKLAAGDEVVVTCTSVTTRVISGTVEITFVAADETVATTVLEEGNSLSFEPATFTFTAPSTNPDVIVVLVDGEEFPVLPGESKTIVEIDVKPGSDPNSINLKDQGLLPVAILGSDSFDVNTINPESIEIGGVNLATRGSAKAPKLAYSYEDVNEDGYMDLMAFFEIQDLVDAEVLTETTTSLVLSAETNNGVQIEGMDSVNIVP